MLSQKIFRYVTYCGLYCKLCAQKSRIPKRASQLRAHGKRMQKVGIEKWVKEQEERVKREVVYADIRYKTENEIR
jgi:hypothetical protein